MSRRKEQATAANATQGAVTDTDENLFSSASQSDNTSELQTDAEPASRASSSSNVVDMLEVEESEDVAKPEASPAAFKESLAKAQQLQAQLLRVQADFDNFRKRTRQEKEELQQYATRKLLADLLPVLDNFERAMAAFAESDTQTKAGVEMVSRQLLGILDKYGVRPMETIGAPFDPKLHEAVMQEPAEGKPVNVVSRELQKGYFIHDKVLRPAMVQVTV